MPVALPTAMLRAPPSAMVLHPFDGPPRTAGTMPITDRLDQLADSVQLAREDCLGLRQEASDLLEYSNAKLDRVTCYLGFLADRTHKLVTEGESYQTEVFEEKCFDDFTD